MSCKTIYGSQDLNWCHKLTTTTQSCFQIECSSF